MDFNNTLHKLGFTPIEATVFITLCKHGALSGYEVAKLTGISRSNIYAALYSLQEKGKCQVSEGETAKYIAISKEELLLSTKRELIKTLSEIEQLYPSPIETHEPYVTIRGYDNVLNKIKNSILLCKSHLYLLCSSSCIDLLRDELLTISSNRRITIICETNIYLNEQIIVYNRQKDPKGIHLIIDTNSVITGDLEKEHAQCLFSKNDSLVRLMRESFVTELDMIALKKH
ncbi:MAG: helix-turn-helix domain-containing protein [Cellulosilyticum sp.]|nr:hypothetical protein [Cellulosilyticum sp.]MEE1071683.1 helix-turn-helix domain-containing protein [Cellulosilyticum sp.]